MVILTDKEAEELGINESLGAFIGKLKGDYTAVANDAKKKEEKKAAKAKKQEELIKRGQAQQQARNEWLDKGRNETKEAYLAKFKETEKKLAECLLAKSEERNTEEIDKLFDDLKSLGASYAEAKSYKDARQEYENKFKNIGKGQSQSQEQEQTTNEEIKFSRFDY